MTSNVNEEVTASTEEKLYQYTAASAGENARTRSPAPDDTGCSKDLENESVHTSPGRARTPVNDLSAEFVRANDCRTESQLSAKSEVAESPSDDTNNPTIMPVVASRPEAEHQLGNLDSSSSLNVPVVSVSVDADDVDTLDEYIRSPNGQNAIAERSPGGRYVRFIEKLGSGASKDVYRAYDTQEGIEVAWNVVNLSGVPKTERNRIVNEVRLLERLHHQNIISFHGSWVNRERQEVNFVTEILSSGTLKSFINKVQVIRWKIAKRWAVQILKGLEYLHSQDPPVIHRDLKCENIFINGTSGDLRIGDLGLSTVHRNGKVLSVLGTPEFMAPDMYEENSYDEKVDIYAFGMCLLEIFTKEIPYKECSNPAQIYKKVSRGDPPESLSRLKSRHAREFIEMCLGYKDENGNYVRPTAGELLTHDFLLKRPNDEDEVEVDRPLQQRTIREMSADSSQAISATKQLASPGADKVVAVGNEGHPPSMEEDESDGFSQMPDSEVNIRKVKVMMGRGQELKEDEVASAHATMQSTILPDIQGDTDERIEAPPSNGSVQVATESFLEGEPSAFPHYLVAAAVIENEPTNSCPHADDVLKLVVTLPVEGQTQNVQFDFHLVEDDPVQVAKEMVAELCIPQEAVLEISETISGLACAARMKQDKYFGQVQGAKLRLTPQSSALISQSALNSTNAPGAGKAAKVESTQGIVTVCHISDVQSRGKLHSGSTVDYVGTRSLALPHNQKSIQKNQDQSPSSYFQQHLTHTQHPPRQPRDFQHVDYSDTLGLKISSSYGTSQSKFNSNLQASSSSPQITDSPSRQAHLKPASQLVEPLSNGDFQSGKNQQGKITSQPINVHPQHLGSSEGHTHSGNSQHGISTSRTVSHTQNAEHQNHQPTAEHKSQTSGQASYSQSISQNSSQQVQTPGQQSLSDSNSTPGLGSSSAHPAGDVVSQLSETHQPTTLYSNQPQGQNVARQHSHPPRTGGSSQPSASMSAPTNANAQQCNFQGLRQSGVVNQSQTQEPSPSKSTSQSSQLPLQSGCGLSSLSPRSDGNPVTLSLPQDTLPAISTSPSTEAMGATPSTPQRSTFISTSFGGNQDLPIGSVLEVPSIHYANGFEDDAIMLAELRKLDEDFQKNMMRAKKVFDNRMDNLQRTQHQREALHLRTLEKHQKERAEFEKRMQQEEIEQNRRIEQLQREWDRRREAVRQKQVVETPGDSHPLGSSPPE